MKAEPDGESYRVDERHCPVCDSLLDGATGVNTDGPPEPGALTICFYCGAPLRFTAEGFDLIPDAEAAALDAKLPEFAAARASVRDRRRTR